MSMRRGRRSSKFVECCVIWTVSWVAAIAASAVRAGPAQSVQAGFDAVKPRRISVLVQAHKQLTELKAVDIFGPAGRAIRLNIETLNANDADHLYILTGIPEGFTLNPGGYFGKFWAVNSKVIPMMTLTAPKDFSGSFTISIVRRQDGSASTAAASFKVTIGEPATTATVATVALPSPPEVARKANPNEAAYLARAKGLLQSGDISGARAIFENLALQGSAAGAMALGETYDPVILRTLVIKGLQADPEKARKWYLKAEELGGPDARSRLNELAGR